MDYERLDKSIEAVDRQDQKRVEQQAKSQARLAKRNQRRQERAAPYAELGARNQAIYDRTSVLAGVLPPISKPRKGDPHAKTFHQVSIVLGPAKPTSTTPDHMVVATVSTHQWTYNGEPLKRADFSFLATDCYAAVTLQNNLTAHPAWPYHELGNESCYVTGLDGELSEHIRENVSDGAFSPIKAFRKVANLREIDKRLMNLETSMDMIDSAARNPELNPVLAHALETSSTAESQTA
ncbi:MAG TPA: hypothetical protein VFH99_01825 [Candidatus Saccharimonadales bacterium]|nr:hypothetical protein [Candidatus Saccharimonadales bacterium]